MADEQNQSQQPQNPQQSQGQPGQGNMQNPQGGAPMPQGFPPHQGMPAGMPSGIPGGMPAGMPGGAPVPPPPEDKTPANYQIGQQLPNTINVKLPAHNLNFDEQKFLHLLAGSISLTKEEKKRIINSLPKLRQEQVDELIRIFEEERRKFAELSVKHVDQLKKLEKQHMADWQDIEME
ncbi:hypothetical protein GF340_05590, partial [Candidatus Peregrinibacteria bacterium]|nr:hypothetical protein [Candidatus Peregrinibacteria bacterium]